MTTVMVVMPTGPHLPSTLVLIAASAGGER